VDRLVARMAEADRRVNPGRPTVGAMPTAVAAGEAPAAGALAALPQAGGSR
jgi:hypothetical protein